MKITEKTLAVKISNEFNIELKKCKQIAKFILDTEKDALEQGGSIVLRGLCTIEGQLQPPKKKTVFGKVLSIAERVKVKVKMSRVFNKDTNTPIDKEFMNLMINLNQSKDEVQSTD